MSRFARNSIAAGLTTLLVSTAMSFAADGATDTTSYAEAQFIAGRNGLGEVVNVVGDGLEDGGSNACGPATDECSSQAVTTSPLEPLEQLTVPLGDQLAGSEIGAAGNFAKTGDGASRASSGAVTQDGIIQVGGGGGTAEADATLDLSAGVLGDLGATDALANVTARIGAVSSSAELTSPTADVERDYNIAGADLTLKVPALAELAEAVDREGDVDLSDAELSVETLCEGLGGSLTVAVEGLGLLPGVSALLGTLGLIDDGGIDLCDNQVVSTLGGADVVEAKITGLNAVTDGLTTFTNDNGVVFDFAQGEIRLDLADVLKNLGTDINDLPENTDIVHAVLPALVLNVDDLLDNLNQNLVDDLASNFGVELTVLDQEIPLDALNEGVRERLLPAVQDGLDGVSDVFAELGDPLADALDQITEGLAPVLQIVVNVPDEYVSLRDSSEVSVAAASEVYSQTAVEIKVLGGRAADLLLANTLVSPISAVDVADDGDGTVADGPGDGPADGNNAADGNDDANNDDGAAATAGGDDSNGSVADADSAADADASATLPNTGAPNLLPFILLGFALLALGVTVLINERRRLGSGSAEALV